MKAHRPDQGKVTILVVDDEASILELLGEYLRARGHKVLTASDGASALTLLDQNTPDVVLSDMKMPGMGGLELLTVIRARPVPIATILMTGYGTIDSAIRSMKDGAHDYLLKPFKLREVHAAITRAVDRIRLERETVRLRQVIGLYQAVHALENPDGLSDIYTLLCELTEQEFNGESALLAFDERDAGEWVEYYRTQRAPFTGLDLQLLGERMRTGDGLPTPWLNDRTDPVLVAPIRAQVSPEGKTQMVGLIAVARPQIQATEAAQALEVYGSIVGDALSRQLLAARMRLPPGSKEPCFGSPNRSGPHAHALRVGDLVSQTAEAVGLTPDQVQIAATAARIHDHAQLGVSLRELIDGADLETLSLEDRSVPSENLSDLAPILIEMGEHFDGHGAPKGRAGEAIHPVSQLVAVADQWDMLTMTRSFAPLLSRAAAAEALRAERGSRFRADVVDSFLDVVTD